MKQFTTSAKNFFILLFSYPEKKIFVDESYSFEKAKTIAGLFYAILVYYALSYFTQWSYSPPIPVNFSPLWPVFWTHYVPFSNALNIMRVFFLTSVLFGAYFFRYRVARIFVFLAFLELFGFINSFGGITPNIYPVLYATFWLMFLPDAWDNPVSSEERKKFLFVFWGTQLFLLLTYTFSAVGKFYYAFVDFQMGRETILAPYALAYYIAHWLPRLQGASLLGPFFVRHQIVGWPFMLFTIYLQFFSFLIAFRPALHRLWALGLTLFHIMSHLTLSLLFPESVLMLLVFFYNSPFYRPNTTLREQLCALPLFGPVLRPLIM
ncbi:MAG: hypothetical protein HY001_03910 [Candidatus Portnoybacteria bacterium]|nr:hypothetical protein [Candidatus Portnoybacteria bacterium]